MKIKKFILGFILLASFVLLGVSYSAERFNREMGEPAAVVFAWQKEEQNQEVRYRGKILGYEFVIFKESLDKLKQNFKQGYLYWKKKIDAIDE